MRHLNRIPEVNAGSMADIAFLLLIFFLVTATISSDEGINRVLPRECPNVEDCFADIHERNIMRILINNKNQIMVNNNLTDIGHLKNRTLSFLDNNGDGTCNYCYGKKNNKDSDNPNSAIISLKSGKLTNYKTYISVQNEITKAYNQLRNRYSMTMFNKSYHKLEASDKQKVKKAYPMKISEAETK
ncbi:ExbD/TolR family protein [Cognatitamlana onchidii]|uniref:ExbD/TolR family protein n=1 Tax=Cognatitamlana onchidii TaxID=2562860 RepID=UPI0010A602A3|nr:biopolymer transporter ExbD [Algibacter onchidii]